MLEQILTIGGGVFLGMFGMCAVKELYAEWGVRRRQAKLPLGRSAVRGKGC